MKEQETENFQSAFQSAVPSHQVEEEEFQIQPPAQTRVSQYALKNAQKVEAPVDAEADIEEPDDGAQEKVKQYGERVNQNSCLKWWTRLPQDSSFDFEGSLNTIFSTPLLDS